MALFSSKYRHDFFALQLSEMQCFIHAMPTTNHSKSDQSYASDAVDLHKSIQLLALDLDWRVDQSTGARLCLAKHSREILIIWT